MNHYARIREAVKRKEGAPTVAGEWRNLCFCPDPYTDEWLNVGVVVRAGGRVEVRVLDHFERLKCLYDTRIDEGDLARSLHAVEGLLYARTSDESPQLGPDFRLSVPRYGAGESIEAIIDEFFDDTVTLARPKARRHAVEFRYRATPKVRQAVVEFMREKLALQAEAIITEDARRIRIKNGPYFDVDVPFMTRRAAGTVVSAWYKSPMVIENTLLRAGSDLALVRAGTECDRISIAVLRPGDHAGLSSAEFRKVDTEIRRHLDRLRHQDVTVIEATSTIDLSQKAADWWQREAA